MKCIKKQKDNKKSGSSYVKPSRLYVYHNQMCFLKKITDTTTTHESIDDKKNEENKTDENEGNREVIMQSASKPGTSGMKRKRKEEVNSELDAKMITFIDHQINAPKNDYDNRHLSFFKKSFAFFVII